MIPEKYQGLPDHFKLLFEWGDPRESGYSYREWDYYLPYGFSDADIPDLIELLSDKNLNSSEDTEQVWVPLYAWRILGQLKSVEAIEPLINLSIEYQTDDWASSEIPVALGIIGKPALARVVGILLDDATEEQKQTAASALAEMAQRYPELREEILNYFQQYLQSPNPDYHQHNGLLTSQLIDLKAIELIDDIRALYKKDYADISISGDIEDVEIEMGFRVERETPRPKYHNSPSMEGLQQLFESLKSDSPAAYDWKTDPNVSKTVVRENPKVGRNEPCPCGSGKKYKRCCMN